MGSRSPALRRRIVGNLDCEVRFAREEAALRAARGEEAPPPDDPRFALPAPVEASISALATLLRAFAEEGDVLWTPRPVDPRRMAAVSGLPLPRLESGRLEDLPAAREILAWGETPEVERARARGPAPASGEAPGERGETLEVLRGIQAAGAAIARKVNHRSFSLEVARSLGLALPGAALVSSPGELEAHLHGGGAEAAPEERWVLKAPHSAAGRLRLKGAGRSLGLSARRRAERLFHLFGMLVFEPWMDRTADFGCTLLLDDSGFRMVEVHVLEVGRGGVFRGIEMGMSGPQDLSPEEKSLLEETAAKVARRLLQEGYRGPFGIDSWRYRDGEGRIRFNPLGEVNARMTFGLVAKVLGERVLRRDAAGQLPAARLRVGKGEDLEKEKRQSGMLVPLLLPLPEEPTAAWLEVR